MGWVGNPQKWSMSSTLLLVSMASCKFVVYKYKLAISESCWQVYLNYGLKSDHYFLQMLIVVNNYSSWQSYDVVQIRLGSNFARCSLKDVDLLRFRPTKSQLSQSDKKEIRRLI